MTTETEQRPQPTAPDAPLDGAALKQLLFACLRPAARLADALGLSLAELQKLVELAYFQRALAAGRKKGEIGAQFGIGATKAAELSRELHQHFLDAERGHGLGRQVLSLLWASPLTLRQMVKELEPFSEHDVQQALTQLLAEERVRPVSGRTARYAPSRSIQRLSIVPWMARVDGLNTLMDHVSLALRAQFVRRDDRALVRNITFQVAAEDVASLHTFYEAQLMPLIEALDARAAGKPDAPTIRLSILWAPEDAE